MLHILRQKTTGLIRIHFFIVALITGFTFSVYGQKPITLHLEDHDDKAYYFGITIGGNLARFHVDNHPRFLQDDSVLVAEPLNSGGFSLGLLATGRLSNRFEARFNPQLMFTERSLFYKLKYPEFGQTDIIKKVESVIVSFPVQLKFRSDRIGNFRVYMLGGVKGDIDLASNASARKAEDLVKIRKYDFGVEGGLGFNFYFQSFILSPEIKFSNGLGNIHSRDEKLKYSSVFDRINSRMIVFSIHIEG